jgi:hypothetical protein
MRRTPRIPLAVACALSFATCAHAAGINLSWNDCGTFGQSVESFACNTNLGIHTLVASFVQYVPLDSMVAVESQIELQVADPVLSPWWNFTTTTGCRSAQFSASADFLAGPYNCVDPWVGQAVGGQDFTAGFGAPNRGRIRVVFAVPPSLPISIDNTSQYYAFKVVFRNTKTVGTGSCDGCSTPACMVLDFIRIDQPTGVGDWIISNVLDRQDVSWQCPGNIVTEGGLCANFCPVPAKKPSWGAIKSLYR